MSDKDNLEKFVSENGFDLCVLCKFVTEYKTDSNVELREYYVDGVGQLCNTCYSSAEESYFEHNFIKKYLDNFF